MRRANARSSIVKPTSDSLDEDSKNGFNLKEALEIRLNAPLRRPKRVNALQTAKLHHTMKIQRNEPGIF